MNKKVLAIGGHPDDVEQFMSGTLLLLKKAGFEITIAALTDGACGSKTKTDKEIIDIRLKEAKNSAKLLGAKHINLGLRDGIVEYNLENLKKIVKLIREVNPLIILTHPTEDYMTDHSHTGRLVLWAVPEAGHPNFTTDTNAPHIENQPYVYHSDPQGLTFADGQIARVNTIVNISDVIEDKLFAFAAHASQMGFLSHQESQNAVEKTRRWAIIRGEQVSISYGEGFSQQLFAEYPKKNILKEILTDKVYTL